MVWEAEVETKVETGNPLPGEMVERWVMSAGPVRPGSGVRRVGGR